jgi:hypothetical protein
MVKGSQGIAEKERNFREFLTRFFFLTASQRSGEAGKRVSPFFSSILGLPRSPEADAWISKEI